MLTVDVTKCSPDAPATTNDGHRYTLGLMLLVLGIPEITAKTLPELQGRQKVWSKLQGRSVRECAEDIQYLRAHMGAKVNGNKLTRAQFFANVTRDIFNEFLR